ncbi:type II toxin-antitoxin system PemK/MazF family toxin [Lactiplantibacillus plantarum]|uniref:type II toxin-antitoxin system PemK/MazF family toxin n=1 Tax=Lactiplantibacillus plantarum TaxID=1590 RepID=UPI0007ABAB43|nr:type II toxin-antitoxin system PemK/MazF family toxin [Lactiplantibacillus plantarum]ASX21874.1 hypothetical protein BGV74_08780 [Lactiplantibacillus plantarum]KZD98479.1 Pathogenicity island SaPIn2 [Lactiplantibacillus plantarum]MDN7039230.1 type II toxin-antitoxin system PemK/MazF family toxin [Lactiplantibacillus plantarum]UTV82622.1 type II toxin-antitoxin system PemK/MazF family toxin [Lactiplantibacillus plantarum]WMY71855.1 type II toxin-antitoxin system PemK/MazF family toxin [Lacti
MKKEQKDILIDQAHDRFKIVSAPDNGKFIHLPHWLNNVSYRYKKEFDDDFPSGYYHYKRGTVIRVDFGVNMGSEFCGIHFAIVLDKKDNNHKRTLTVVPLTSKQRIGRFSLGKEIFNQTLAFLRLRIDELQKEVKSMNPEQSDFTIALQSLKNEIQQYRKVYDIYKNYDKNSFVRLSDITTISKFRIQKVNRFDPSGNIRLTSEQMGSISNELKKLYLTE